MDEIPATTISRELNQVIGSRDLVASTRMRQLLEYLVNCTLGGETRRLNQRRLALDFFQRGEDFDPEQDAIVRVEMGKLRRALQQYYETAAPDGAVKISVPKGRYIPRFERLSPCANSSDPSPQLVDMPELAVGKVICLSKGVEDQRLAESLEDEIAVSLAQIPFLKVRTEPAQPVARGYCLKVKIKRSDACLRVTAQLQDRASEELAWSNRLDYPLKDKDGFALLDDIVAAVAAHCADVYSGVINRRQISQIDLNKSSSFSLHEAILLFYRYLTAHSDESYHSARHALEDVYIHESAHPLLYAMMADIRRSGYSHGYTNEPDPIGEVLKLAQQAVALAPDSATARLALAYALLQARRKQEMLEALNPLLTRKTVSPSYSADAAIALALSGEWGRGCRLIEEVKGKLASPPHIFFYPAFLHTFLLGDYSKALQMAHRFPPTPVFWQPLFTAAVLGKLDRQKEAQSYLGELLHKRPTAGQHCRRWLSCFMMEDELVDGIIDGLNQAGLPITEQ